MSGPSRFGVFAVEDTAAQLCWAALPANARAIEVGGVRYELGEAGQSPGAITVRSLTPASNYEVMLDDGGSRRRLASFATLASPPGELLCRVSTISDIHLGERGFGAVMKIKEARTLKEDGYPLRCARAAIAESVEWGAETLIVKGDLTWSGRANQFKMVAALINESPIPALVTLGNHDVFAKSVDAERALGAGGVPVIVHTTTRDLPGLRIIVLPTVIAHHRDGTIARDDRDAAVDAAADARRSGVAVLVAAHHYPQRFNRALGYPPAIPAPIADDFLRGLAAANPKAFFTAGHAHRNRAWIRHGVPITIVGATKDYPGVWGGYAVHEGGIRQVVTRVAEPSSMAWTDRSRGALFGLWGYWSPGLRSHRCFTHAWRTT